MRIYIIIHIFFIDFIIPYTRHNQLHILAQFCWKPPTTRTPVESHNMENKCYHQIGNRSPKCLRKNSGRTIFETASVAVEQLKIMEDRI